MAVPIIGASQVSEDWLMTIPITCGGCHTHFLLVGQVGAMRACPNHDCQRMHRLMDLPRVNPASGQVEWQIGIAEKPVGGWPRTV